MLLCVTIQYEKKNDKHTHKEKTADHTKTYNNREEKTFFFNRTNSDDLNGFQTKNEHI